MSIPTIDDQTREYREPDVVVTGIELRDLDTDAGLTRMEGRAVPYDVETNVGFYREVFRPKSLGKSTGEASKGLPLHLFHDSRTWPIGVSESWDERSDGLYGTWRFSDTAEARMAAEQVRDGMLNYMSIGFQPIRSNPILVDDFNPTLGPEHMDLVERIEARLLEVSLVSTPAYRDAIVTKIRDRRGREGTPALDAWKAELEKLRAGA